MVEKKNFLKITIAFILICCLSFSGCAANTPHHDTEINNTEIVGGGTKTTAQPPATQKPPSTPAPTPASVEEYYHAPMPEQVVPEGKEIVTLGTFGKVEAISPMYKAVNAFNQAQDKYFVKIEIYNNYDQFLIDIARKQGADLYSLYQGVSADLLARQGILEDLTPYFERSNTISKEDIVEAVWRAGSVDDKLYFLIPSFICYGLLVEKGHTNDGAWSGKDYIALGKKYPDSMLNRLIKNPSAQILSELREYMAAFIDFENRTCSFDSDEFISLLENLKALSDRNYEAVDENATIAELIRGKTYLSRRVSIKMDPGLSSYRDIVEAFGNDYEIAGDPTADGSLKYTMDFNFQIYGMNANSGNKEGVWAFFEYLLSEEYQQPNPPRDLDGQEILIGSGFPARKDSLERGLQANVDYVTDPGRPALYRRNTYTNESLEEYEHLPEDARQRVLHIIDNSYRPAFNNDYTLLNILFEECEPFFQGDKSVKDVVKIIQSKITLYLAE